MTVVSAVVLLVQISATRLLSATVTYHAAFAVLALVMLALAGSATAVYRDRAAAGGAAAGLGPAARAAALAGPVVAATGMAYVAVGSLPWPAGLYVFAHFVAAAVLLYACFHVCGYVVAWLLASWPSDVGRVYFADLVGAALGCLLAVPLLASATPVQLLCACGAGCSLAGVLLAGEPAVRRQALASLAALSILTVAVFVQPGLVRLRSAKSEDQSTIAFERWNQLARVTVSHEIPGTLQAMQLLEKAGTTEDPRAEVLRWSAGWGMSEEWKGEAPESMWIELDTDAGTQILRGGGTRPLEDFEALRWDATAVAYWLRPGDLRRTFVIGGGGGRDFLTALVFGARQVDVVELNPLVVHVVQDVFADYSGRPYTREGVSYRVGDARSELSRSDQRYDLIQMSMIDTWASSATGALTLSENALYTREAFHSWLSHLTDEGIFTVSRWYSVADYAETARVVSLMGDALRSAGVADPENHLAVVTNATSRRPSRVASCLMKKSPFEARDLEVLADVAARTGFEVLWPRLPGDTKVHPFDVRAVARGDEAALHKDGFDITPPDDDRPFFFYTSATSKGAQVPILFGALIGVIVVGGSILVFAPLRAAPGAGAAVKGAGPAIAYFAAIGAGFLGVELGVLQRYIVFLGHPTYALSVVLFSLLLSTALGSLAVGRRPSLARAAFPALFVLLAATTFAVPPLLEAWHGWPMAARVVVAGAFILPLGACMGMALPAGVAALAASGREALVPWMWAVNGFTGTLASVLGMIVAMEAGYTVLLVLSGCAYLVAWGASTRLAR